MADPSFVTEITHQIIWIKQLRRIAKWNVLLQTKAFAEMDRMAVLRC
jgi:hypothetical protein